MINGKVNTKELRALRDRLDKSDIDEFMVDLTKNLSGRLLSKTYKRTLPAKVNGGTLQKGWKANDKEVRKVGKTYSSEISNPVEYASYVESGHRTRKRKDGKRGWVEGKHMLSLSEAEIQKDMPKIIEAKLKKRLGDVLDGK